MIYHETSSGKLHQGEVLDILHTLPDESVNCCVTSPPYWGLRDYGTAEWVGGDAECDHQVGRFEYAVNEKQVSNNGSAGHQAKDICPKCGAVRKDRQLGLERTPEEYVARMVEIFREVRRVLTKDGTLWLNLGDSYWGGKGTSSQAWSTENQDRETLQKSYHQITGKGETRPSDGKHDIIKPKDLVGIPWRVAFALQADGWYLRQDLIWHKPNPMPESVTDRCTKSHEYVFLMSKSAKYYYDNEAIREDIKIKSNKELGGVGNYSNGIRNNNNFREYDKIKGANKRSVWTVTTKPFKEAHFATFPRDLIRPMIQAGCPEQVCVKCGKARYPILKNTEKQHSIGYSSGDYWKTRDFKGDNTVRNKSVKVGYTDCGCNAGFQPGIVLDPFMGSGTTAIEAIYQGKRYIGIDLNPDYCAMAAKRIDAELEQTTIFEEEETNDHD